MRGVRLPPHNQRDRGSSSRCGSRVGQDNPDNPGNASQDTTYSMSNAAGTMAARSERGVGQTSDSAPLCLAVPRTYSLYHRMSVLPTLEAVIPTEGGVHDLHSYSRKEFA